MNSIANPSARQHLVLYFQVHQPRRLNTFSSVDSDSDIGYFDDKSNAQIMKRIAGECYLPTNLLFLELIKKHPQLRLAFSISGSTLEQFEQYSPEVLESFQHLVATGRVEMLGETYYHSLASVMEGDEFEIQILQHSEKIYKHFGVRPRFFRNTELIYEDTIGQRIYDLGFHGIFCDGIYRILGQQSPHFVYQHPTQSGLKLLLRSYQLSDDIAFRFHDLTVDKYLSWLNAIPQHQRVINLAMDYETFGEHQKATSGIHSFLFELIKRLAEHGKFTFSTPSEAIGHLPVHNNLPVPYPISWANQERDLSAWLGNEMQRDAFDRLKKLEDPLRKLDQADLLNTWRTLMTSDHFYYMSTKQNDDGQVHASYFSPYASPHEAFTNYMNVLSDFTIQVDKAIGIFEDTIEKNKVAEYERRNSAEPLWATQLVSGREYSHTH